MEYTIDYYYFCCCCCYGYTELIMCRMCMKIMENFSKVKSERSPQYTAFFDTED